MAPAAIELEVGASIAVCDSHVFGSCAGQERRHAVNQIAVVIRYQHTALWLHECEPRQLERRIESGLCPKACNGTSAG